MPIADRMVPMVAGAALIKGMFEEGARLKAAHGADRVCDFSLGNPDIAAPREFREALVELASDPALGHGYMPGPGHPHVRRAVAGYLSRQHPVELTENSVIMTVGAAGGLNIVLKALVNPGEEILTPAPYFVGYPQYAFLADAALVTAPSRADFHLDPAAVEAAITERTRVVLVNSPNNPTGAVYTAGEMNALAEVLERAGRRFGRRIYLVADEPYRRIAYGVQVPSVFAAYPHAVVVTSFSKDLSLAGERIGYLAVSPRAEDADLVLAAAGAINTALYVNAPSLLQLAVARVLDACVDVSVYRRRRDLLCAGLAAAGYDVVVPEGAFYLFPRSPIRDDAAFCRLLLEELILAVPGRAFGGPGHFRISYAVPSAVIAASMAGFGRAMDRARGGGKAR